MQAAIRTLGVAGFTVALLPLLGCSGGIHYRGEHQLSLLGSYGEPISGQALYWPDAEGRARNGGVTVGYGYFAQDRLQLLATATPYRNYNQSDGDVATGEIQIGFRYFFAEFDLAEKPFGLYAEVLGGLLYGAQSVPEEGSNFNFTQDAGLGFELRLNKHISWVTGYRLRHLSNGNFFNDDNPAQNDHQVYSGIAIHLD